MSVSQCETLISNAVKQLITQINSSQIPEFNEATIQHHLALQLHLLGKQTNSNFQMILEKRVRLQNGFFPKKRKKIADIDIFFKYDDKTRCAIEMKVFKRENHREPNNRYDTFADIGNLEIYNGAFADVGFFLLLTDHPHYYDNDFRAFSQRTKDFNFRDGSYYIKDTELSYNTAKPYGAPIKLSNSYKFNWTAVNGTWKLLLVKVT